MLLVHSGLSRVLLKTKEFDNFVRIRKILHSTKLCRNMLVLSPSRRPSHSRSTVDRSLGRTVPYCGAAMPGAARGIISDSIITQRSYLTSKLVLYRVIVYAKK